MLIGTVELTKNADLDKYKYSCYSIGFDSRSEFSWEKMLFFLGSDMNSTVHVDNKNKDKLIFVYQHKD